jgi:hypothetical protein
VAVVTKAGQRDNNPVKLSAVYDRDSGLRVTLLVELAGVQEHAGELGAAIDTLQQAVSLVCGYRDGLPG